MESREDAVGLSPVPDCWPGSGDQKCNVPVEVIRKRLLTLAFTSCQVMSFKSIHFIYILTGIFPRSTVIRYNVLTRVTSGVFKASKDAPIFFGV